MNADLGTLAFAGGAFGVSTVLSWLGVRRALAFARSRAVLDVPSARSSHHVPTPRGGGLGIVFTIVTCLVAEAVRRGDAGFALPALAVVVACALGFADDRKSLPAWPKMIVLLGAAALALPQATVRHVEVPYVGLVDLGVLAVPLSILWMAGFANAFNFMDGINGISGVTAVVSGLGFATAGVLAGDDRVAVLGAVVAGAGLGFLPWNFPDARIFMGDSGSLPLGICFAFLAATAATFPDPAGNRAGQTLPFPAGVLMLGPYLFDVTFTLVRRIRAGKSVGEAHSEHLYQRLARGLGGHAPAVWIYATLAALTSALALAYGLWGDFGRALSILVPPLALLALAPLVFDLEGRRKTTPPR